LCKKSAKLVAANLGRIISLEIRETHLVASLQSQLPWRQTLPWCSSTFVVNLLTVIQYYFFSLGQDPIYHTLEPGSDETNAATIEVMLPSGQLVPATLVRNATGRIVPLVQVPCDYDEDRRRWNGGTISQRHAAATASRRDGGRSGGGVGGLMNDGGGAERFGSPRSRTSSRPLGYQYRV
jgi:hypothetical protein